MSKVTEYSGVWTSDIGHVLATKDKNHIPVGRGYGHFSCFPDAEARADCWSKLVRIALKKSNTTEEFTTNLQDTYNKNQSMWTSIDWTPPGE